MAKPRVGDTEPYYETEGQGPPLVFIHGLGSSTRDWDRQLSFFSRHYRVIAFDVRGHGRSDRPSGPYSVPLFARDTAELVVISDSRHATPIERPQEFNAAAAAFLDRGPVIPA
jgi:pimeloyl-ACP methyl ester carboxylesterase